MKKILLASTILAGTAGFAAADNANFTFSGEAYTGVAFSMGYNEVALATDLDGDGFATDTDVTFMQPEVTASVTISMMTTTDGGLEAGASFDIDGNGVRIEDDNTDSAFGRRDFTGGIGDVTAYVSGEWGKFEAAFDGTTTTILPFGTGGNVDFTYTNSIGDFDVKVWYEYVFGPNNDEYGAKGTYNFADYSVWASAEYQEDIGIPPGTGDLEIGAGASASMNGFSGDVEAYYRLDSQEWKWKASAAYSMDAFSFGAFVEDDDNGPTFLGDGDLDYGVNASYDLGGGVSVDASYTFDQDADANGDGLYNDAGIGLVKLGVSMAF